MLRYTMDQKLLTVLTWQNIDMTIESSVQNPNATSQGINFSPGDRKQLHYLWRILQQLQCGKNMGTCCDCKLQHFSLQCMTMHCNIDAFLHHLCYTFEGSCKSCNVLKNVVKCCDYKSKHFLLQHATTHCNINVFSLLVSHFNSFQIKIEFILFHTIWLRKWTQSVCIHLKRLTTFEMQRQLQLSPHCMENALVCFHIGMHCDVFPLECNFLPGVPDPKPKWPVHSDNYLPSMSETNKWRINIAKRLLMLCEVWNKIQNIIIVEEQQENQHAIAHETWIVCCKQRYHSKVTPSGVTGASFISQT